MPILNTNDVENLTGLSESDAEANTKKYGLNELPSSKKKSVFKIVFEVLREPMFLLLVACGSIYLLLGDIQEALMLLSFVFVIMGITVYQENKTENALDALRDLSSPRALVIRNGQQKVIAGKFVVKDDIIILKEGDRIPADAVLLWGLNLSVDESVLTGESVPVRKLPSKENNGNTAQHPGGDDLPFLYSSCLVVQGQGVARVSNIGINTELGKIGKTLASIDEEDTTLQKETSKIVKNIFILVSFLCAFIILVYGLLQGKWIDGILSGLTLAMAMLPEEFPVVLTVFLALGAWRISKRDVLTRKISAVETLGSATVLCCDKTGTITQNKMSISMIFSKDSFLDVSNKKDLRLPEQFHELVEYGVLASKKDPFDPMDKALKELGLKTLYDTEHLHNWPMVEEYPLSRELLALSHVWEIPKTEYHMVAAKGAPEAIFDLCHMDPGQKEQMLSKVKTMAREGLRVLGVAKAEHKGEPLPKHQHDFNFEFVGLIGLSDPIRASVPEAVMHCYRSGIRVIMITGDYPETAHNIAKQIGLKDPDNILTGTHLKEMPFEELRAKIAKVNVFARVVPEQKLLIVKALKANGEVVAMTGDGVNDAPALKAANIGVAMGQRGTDVARESSAIVLLKDDFSSIVAAVRLGRRIFDGLKKAMAYIVSIHVPIAGLSLLPVLTGWPVILYPVHIVFLELIIDPACSLVFEGEAEEPGIMDRPPRGANESLFGKKMLIISLLQGAFSLLAVVTVLAIALWLNKSPEEARTLAFCTLIVSNIGLILTNRSWTKLIVNSFKDNNPALSWVISGAILFLGAVLYIPFLSKLFHFGPMHAIDLFITLVAGILAILWFEAVKYFCVKNHYVLLKN
ncbi:MAG: cation-translocating P-type ATPase [Candidatus Margulisiibacteriota bacterium]